VALIRERRESQYFKTLQAESENTPVISATNRLAENNV
jgi:hypothetical protein